MGYTIYFCRARCSDDLYFSCSTNVALSHWSLQRSSRLGDSSMIVGPDRTLTHSSSRKILRLLKMPVETKSTAHLGLNCYCLVVVNGKRVLKTKTLSRQPRAVGDCSSLLHNSGKQNCAFIRESLQGIVSLRCNEIWCSAQSCWGWWFLCALC